MVKNVYGASAEGSGHSSRAHEIITHIEGLGHIVTAVSSDRGYQNLKDGFDLFENEGLNMASFDPFSS